MVIWSLWMSRKCAWLLEVCPGGLPHSSSLEIFFLVKRACSSFHTGHPFPPSEKGILVTSTETRFGFVQGLSILVLSTGAGGLSFGMQLLSHDSLTET